MRLIDFGQKEDYYPLERGESFPQFYENGDQHRWDHPMLWHYRFWHLECLRASPDEQGMLLMGGEL